MVFLQATEHDLVCHQPELSEGLFARAIVSIALDVVENLLFAVVFKLASDL